MDVLAFLFLSKKSDENPLLHLSGVRESVFEM